MFNLKARKLGIVAILLAVIVPSLVMATVMISYTFPTSTNQVPSEVYMTEGPNYGVANSLHLVYANGASGQIASGTIVYINTTEGSYQTGLLNVFAIYNGSTAQGPVYVTLYAPSINGLTMYASTSQLTATNSTNGITVNGIQVSTTGTTFHLTSSGDALYIGFLLTGSAYGTSTFVINYQIG